MWEKGFEINTGDGTIETVYKIKDQEMVDHIRNKGFLPYKDAYPEIGGYYGYDPFGEGSHIVYSKDFVESQINVEEDMER